MTALAATSKKTVLISGGSIAGPATAFWLNRYGFQTTLVERWPGVRPGGQSVEVNYYGLHAIRRMDLEPSLRARFTGEKGSILTDKNNKVYAQLPVGNGPTHEFEILRGDFAEMLYEETKDDTEWVFGDYITSVEEQDSAGKVKVGFHSGKESVYDFVILADGARSWTRKLIFGTSGFEYRTIGSYIAYFSIPLEDSSPYSDQWHIVPLPRKRIFFFRPDFKAGTSRASVMFLSPTSQGYEKLPPAEQKRVLAELLVDGGENAERMLRGLERSDDLYFEYLGQVHAPRWSTPGGRVLMVGDAAWCGTPYIGMGTSLSCAGAYILAGEMAKHADDPRAAAEGFHAHMGPIVRVTQPLAPGVLWLFFQETEWGVKVFCRIATVVEVLARSKTALAVFGFMGRVWMWARPSAMANQKLPEYGEYVVYPKGSNNSK